MASENFSFILRGSNLSQASPHQIRVQNQQQSRSWFDEQFDIRREIKDTPPLIAGMPQS